MAGVLVFVLAGSVSGCHRVHSRPDARSLVVFAAASLNSAFTRIGRRFQADNPGVNVTFNFAGSSELATQLTEGARADVFASADRAQMGRVGDAGLLAADPTDFATNTLMIVTAPGNPKGIDTFADLGRPGLAVVVCQQPVPCGVAAWRIEEATGIYLQPASEEPSVADALNKVSSGQADAALVYRTDAADAGAAVAAITFPEAAGAVNVYPIAVLNTAADTALAQSFVAMVTTGAGRQILDRSGFARP